ncbi:RCC1 domain-containing protein [Achromobacter xylosoxidans]|uniref:RCC1 domain-containing protein n=1 Tax=Achromobacter anxifer TaxID=1287737 RepID=UPI00155BFD9B|nr:biotin transporter BioY [Achromobacter anxifer]CAB5514524.1 hypothetical protein LMG26857_03583 [Achromobacter anxifer]
MSRINRILTCLAVSALLAQPGLAAAGGFFVVTPSPGKLVKAPEANVIVTLTPAELPAATVQTPYSFNIADLVRVTGDPTFDPGAVKFEVSSKDGSFPSALVMDEHGLLSGSAAARTTPTGSRFEVQATYKDKSGRQTYTIIVNGRPLQAVAIAKAGSHACAVTPEGGLVCWGANGSGELGDGTTFPRASPVPVVGMASGVTAVAVGGTNTCAIQSGGLKCWGYNGAGQLADGTTQSSRVPLSIPGMNAGVTKVAVGNASTICAVQSGAAYCWGYNSQGQVGDGTTTGRTQPTQVVGLTSAVTDISTRSGHSCAVQGTNVVCWGANYAGQIGDGTTALRFTPTTAINPGQMGRYVAVGNDHTCAIYYQGVPPRDTRRVRCWGANASGQLGDGSTAGSLIPLELNITQPSAVTAGTGFSCASTASGVACWGANGSGQLGTGDTGVRQTPSAVVGLGAVSQFSAGDDSVCAIQSGLAKCWGSNAGASLGDGTTATRLTPVSVQLQ